MTDQITFSLFSDLHWRKGDWSQCEGRLDAILGRAAREKAEFVIHCGDFCHDVAAARDMIARYAAAPVPAWHVMGNHEFENSSSLAEVLSAFGMERNFYAFDVRSFRFVALDTNYHHSPDGTVKHYADESAWEKCHQQELLLPPEQEEFLIESIAAAPGPVCVFSHGSFLRPPEAGGIAGGAAIVRRAGEARGGRPVMWFNGHYHRNALFLRDGMAFMEVNTTTSLWTDETHSAFPPELMAREPTACHSILFSDPVHAIVRLSTDGEVEIEGQRGGWFMGVSPVSLGIDATDRFGLPPDPNVLSAKFRNSTFQV